MKVYLSATYKDLVEYRSAAYQQLRRMRHDVIGMEDYVAADERPLARCLADVAACDVYVGIFAWRYGFVPKRGNPKKLSITELEYRHAAALKKPCLVFLAREDAPWPIAMTDSHTGEGQSGKRIKALRSELGERHQVSFFTTTDQLASYVAPAIFGVSGGPGIAFQQPLLGKGPARRVATGNAKPRVGSKGLWTPGDILRVRFMEENPAFERAVRRFAPLWSVYANIHFEFSADDGAEVRISFDKSTGNWSFLGTDSLTVPLSEPTMNFGYLEPPEVCVLHEFGHVLGLRHEHNHPSGSIRWKKQVVYRAMAGPPNLWDRHTTEHNLLGKWDPTVFPIPKPFDPRSIMAYPMPKEWTGLNAEFGYADTLSATDKEFIGNLYPYE